MNTIWLLTGSQHLYGDEALQEVAAHSEEVGRYLNGALTSGVRILVKPVCTTREQIEQICMEATTDDQCVGVMAWMHTFSPAKMWSKGLKVLGKPLLHFHTQFNDKIPFDTIDMDFMNLNQSAHGGREFGYICTYLGIERKVVVGHWKDHGVLSELDIWIRACIGRASMKKVRVARFGDNMRSVAVTEGNKVMAESDLNIVVDGYGIGDVLTFKPEIHSAEVQALVQEYHKNYDCASITSEQSISVEEAAAIEIAIERFLTKGNYQAFTTTFEDLHGFHQLPGLGVQRLMEKGYGFAAEGDWKTAALLYVVKNMSVGLEGGTSFMEDYTYHFTENDDEDVVLGAHMLEICPSIAAEKPSLQVHPLGIGGKEDPARLVFNGTVGPALNISLVELRGRYRLVVNKVESVVVPEMPHLPVARVLWKPEPSLKESAKAWIKAGGSHHTVYTQAIGKDHIVDLSELLGLELIVIESRK